MLKKLQRELPTDSFTLVNAASAAIDNKDQLARLEQNHAWQSIKAVSLDISWPETKSAKV